MSIRFWTKKVDFKKWLNFKWTHYSILFQTILLCAKPKAVKAYFLAQIGIVRCIAFGKIIAEGKIVVEFIGLQTFVWENSHVF